MVRVVVLVWEACLSLTSVAFMRVLGCVVMENGRVFLSWHAEDLVRDNPETREPGILIVTDHRMLHYLHNYIMTHELECAAPLPSTLWTKR